MDESYEGGQFCKGLLFSKEATKVLWKIGNTVMNQKKDEAVITEKQEKKLKANFLQ